MKLIVAVVVLACVVAAQANYATPALNHCNMLKNATSCDAQAGQCVWCKCAAIPSGCFTPAQAAKLPKGVFECGSSALVATPDVSIQSCATSSALLSGTAVSFSPTTPKAGSPLVVSVTGTLSEQVTSGTLNFEVSILGITLDKKTMSICDVGITCPIASGAVKFSITEDIPSDAPPGTYDLKVSATAGTGAQITCFSASVTL